MNHIFYRTPQGHMRHARILIGGHALELSGHLEALVYQPAVLRELATVELSDVEPRHLPVEAPRVPVSRGEAEDHVEESAARAPRLEEREERLVPASLLNHLRPESKVKGGVLRGDFVKVGVGLLVVVEQHEGRARLEAGQVGIEDVARLLHDLAHREEDVGRDVRARHKLAPPLADAHEGCI
eukprot:scaffold68619_cov61-Phaeocystis_antarctica.AAC.4